MCQGKLDSWNKTHFLRVIFHAIVAKNATIEGEQLHRIVEIDYLCIIIKKITSVS